MWTCAWCGRHMLDSDDYWGIYSHYCSERCEKESKESRYGSKSDNVEVTVNFPKRKPCKSFISMPDDGIGWTINSLNSITIKYGRIVNSGKALSGLLRIALYSYDDDLGSNECFLGSVEFPDLDINEFEPAGEKTITINSQFEAGKRLCGFLEEFKKGQWYMVVYGFGYWTVSQDLIDQLKKADEQAENGGLSEADKRKLEFDKKWRRHPFITKSDWHFEILDNHTVEAEINVQIPNGYFKDKESCHRLEDVRAAAYYADSKKEWNEKKRVFLGCCDRLEYGGNALKPFTLTSDSGCPVRIECDDLSKAINKFFIVTLEEKVKGQWTMHDCVCIENLEVSFDSSHKDEMLDIQILSDFKYEISGKHSVQIDLKVSKDPGPYNHIYENLRVCLYTCDSVNDYNDTKKLKLIAEENNLGFTNNSGYWVVKQSKDPFGSTIIPERINLNIPDMWELEGKYVVLSFEEKLGDEWYVHHREVHENFLDTP